MKEAIFSEKQNEITYYTSDNKIYINICLNEIELEDKQYQYDFNHIIIPVEETTLLERIINNPSKYINYEYKKISQIEQIQADIDYLKLMV